MIELTVLWRLLPALAVAVAVGVAAVRPRRVGGAWPGLRLRDRSEGGAAGRRGAVGGALPGLPGLPEELAGGRRAQLRWAVDEVLAAVVVGGIAGRLAWLVLEGPTAWRSALSTVLLVRSGIETWVGIGAVALLLVRRRERWVIGVAVTAGLAGLAAWHGLCGVEGVCAGRPAAWGVTLPGYLTPVIPTAYVEAGVAGALAAVAWQWRNRPAAAVAVFAGYALARGLLAYWRAPLTSLPTRDQIGALVAAAVLSVLAARWRERPASRPQPGASASPGDR